MIPQERINTWRDMFETIDANEVAERDRKRAMVKKIEDGEQYFTWWITGMSGPHTYNGQQNMAFDSLIRGDIAELTKAQAGFDYMFERWTLDSEREFAEQMTEIFKPARVAAEMAMTSDVTVLENLQALKDQTGVLLDSWPGVTTWDS